MDEYLYDFNITQDIPDHDYLAKYKFNQNYKDKKNLNDDDYKYTNIIYGYGNLEFIMTYKNDNCINDNNIILKCCDKSLWWDKNYA